MDGESEEIVSPDTSGASEILIQDQKDAKKDVKDIKPRKRPAQKEEWKRNVLKKQRNSGQEYTPRQGKVVPARAMKPACKLCRFKCTEKICEDSRTLLFDEFWQLGDLQRQRNYVHKMMKMSMSKGEKKKFNQYFVEVDGKTIRVCREFFLNTFNISERFVRTVVNKSSNGKLEVEKRGTVKSHKLDSELCNTMHSFIDKIPRMESHYLRSQTTREYIDGGKSLSDIYRDFKSQQEQVQAPVGSYESFRNLFLRNFNISFFVPKKDSCNTCETYGNANEAEKLNLQDDFNDHNKKKEETRLQKELDKQLALKGDIIAACFDLQATLPTPYGNINAFYYKSRLATFNFTVYDMGTRNGHCFVWHEGNGNRGANEIGTGLFNFLSSHAVGKPICLYADNCPGQNKNRYILAILLHAVKVLNIPEIRLVFLIVGHTQNEGDNMHSLIEKQKKRALKSGPICTPDQWISVISAAKKTGEPYKITEFEWSDFLDLKNLACKMGLEKATLKNTRKEKVLWSKISEFKVVKEKSEGFGYKYRIPDDYSDVELIPNAEQMSEIILQRAYKGPIPINESKKKGLLALCDGNLLPKKHHAFFNSLA